MLHICVTYITYVSTVQYWKHGQEKMHFTRLKLTIIIKCIM